MGNIRSIIKRNYLGLSELNDTILESVQEDNLSFAKSFLNDLGYMKQNTVLGKLLNYILGVKNKLIYKEPLVNSMFIKACQNSNLELVKYLIESEELLVHPNENCINVRGFRWASSAGSLDLIKYLLEREDAGCDIHMSNDFLFRFACHTDNFEILNYLIINRNIQRTEYIDEYLLKEPHLKAESLFSLRELNAKLKKDLIDKPFKNTEKMVKI